ncbi:MAG TPA: tetratricopeptide repeat protein [Lacipirellula sp.]
MQHHHWNLITIEVEKAAVRRRMKTLLSALLASCLVAGCGSSEEPLSDSNQKYIDAKELLAQGEQDKALAALDASIKAKPNFWALRDRARIHAERGEDEAAQKDCEAALAIVPADSDVLWIKGELAKPVAQRFQGAAKSPPSSNR